MICGPCATDNHRDCNGFLKTSLAFCECADRAHHPAPLADDARIIRQRNDAIVTEHIRNFFLKDTR